ncbi:hypothetical protein V1477_021101, partial [Vespula maculifrons]
RLRLDPLIKSHCLVPLFQALQNCATLVFPNFIVKHKYFTFFFLFLSILNRIMNTKTFLFNINFWHRAINKYGAEAFVAILITQCRSNESSQKVVTKK